MRWVWESGSSLWSSRCASPRRRRFTCTRNDRFLPFAISRSDTQTIDYKPNYRDRTDCEDCSHFSVASFLEVMAFAALQAGCPTTRIRHIQPC
jgi:hypothetical protein